MASDFEEPCASRACLWVPLRACEVFGITQTAQLIVRNPQEKHGRQPSSGTLI